MRKLGLQPVPSHTGQLELKIRPWELARDIEKFGESEPSVKCEVPGDCDVELNALLGALTIDQQERLSN